MLARKSLNEIENRVIVFYKIIKAVTFFNSEVEREVTAF